MLIALTLATYVLTAVLVVLALAIATRRWWRERFLINHERRLSTLRPALLRVLSEDEPSLEALDTVAALEPMAEDLAWSLLPKVRGSSRDVLSTWLQSRGAVLRAEKASRSRGSVRRARAAERLGAAGVLSTEPIVAKLLRDRNQEVRIVAARALGKMGHAPSVPRLLDALEGKRPVASSLISMAIIHMGPSAIDELVLGLGRRSARARSVCAELLGVHGAYQATRWLATLVENDPSIEVRASSAAALGRIGSPMGTTALTRATAVGKPASVRISATRALGRIGGDELLPTLHIIALDEHADVSAAATEALAEMGEPGIRVLDLIASGNDDHARRARDWKSRAELEAHRQRRRVRV